MMYTTTRPAENRGIMNYWVISGMHKYISPKFKKHDTKHSSKKSIAINPTYGTVWFGSTAINLMQLQFEEHINFIIIDGILFLYKCSKSEGVKVMRGMPNNLRVQSRKLGNVISSALDRMNAIKTKPIDFKVRETQSFFGGKKLFELKPGSFHSRLYFK